MKKRKKRNQENEKTIKRKVVNPCSTDLLVASLPDPRHTPADLVHDLQRQGGRARRGSLGHLPVQHLSPGVGQGGHHGYFSPNSYSFAFLLLFFSPFLFVYFFFSSFSFAFYFINIFFSYFVFFVFFFCLFLLFFLSFSVFLYFVFILFLFFPRVFS